MKYLIMTIFCAVLLVSTHGCKTTEDESETTETAKPQTDKEKISYSIGVNMAQSMAEIKDEIDLAMLQQGMTDKINGNALLVSDGEARTLLQAFSEKLRAKQQEMVAKANQENLELGQAYLKENKAKEGVITTESGLQYMVLKEGQGKTPEKTDSVKVHYKGTKLDGTEFDSSYKRGQPATFQADRVIKGWTEGLQLMKEGGKYKLFIPSDLAYGVNGAGQQIGPNEALIFDIELLEVLKEESSDTKPE